MNALMRLQAETARASRAVFGALAEHTFRSARAPTGAAEAAALPDAKHIPRFPGGEICLGTSVWGFAPGKLLTAQ